MLFAISALDKPGHLEKRLATRADHLAYWQGSGVVVLAGPYLDDEGNPLGSLIVVKADDKASAQALVDADPYNLAGVFESVAVRPWNWVFNAPEGL